MSNGDRQYFPLQLRPNHWTTDQQSPIGGRTTSIRWRRMVRTIRRRTDHRDQVRIVFNKLEVCEAESTQAICRCLKVLCRMEV